MAPIKLKLTVCKHGCSLPAQIYEYFRLRARYILAVSIIPARDFAVKTKIYFKHRTYHSSNTSAMLRIFHSIRHIRY